MARTSASRTSTSRPAINLFATHYRKPRSRTHVFEKLSFDQLELASAVGCANHHHVRLNILESCDVVHPFALDRRRPLPSGRRQVVDVEADYGFPRSVA